jgi:hypothetical protein
MLITCRMPSCPEASLARSAIDLGERASERSSLDLTPRELVRSWSLQAGSRKRASTGLGDGVEPVFPEQHLVDDEVREPEPAVGVLEEVVLEALRDEDVPRRTGALGRLDGPGEAA